MPKRQSKCMLKNALADDTLAIKIKKVDLICGNGLWLFQLLRQDPVLLPLFYSLGKDFLQYRHENTGVDETKMCVADPSKPMTAGQTGSAHLKTACSNNIPKGDSTAFQQTETNLLHNHVKTLNISKSPKATETAEQ